MSVQWMTTTVLSQTRLTVVSIVGWGGFGMWAADIIRGEGALLTPGVGCMLAASVVAGLDSFHEARSGRWIEPDDYAADERRGAVRRILISALFGAGIGALMALAWSWVIGEPWSAVAPFVVGGCIAARVVRDVIRHACRQSFAAVHASHQPPVVTDWIDLPAPVLSNARRALATAAIGGGLLVSAATAPEFGPAGISIPADRRAQPRHARTAFVLSGVSLALAIRSAKKDGAPVIVRR